MGRERYKVKQLPIALIIIVAVLAFIAARALLTHFVCPSCGSNFRVGVLKYTFSAHVLNKRLVKCPNCGHAEMLSPVWGKGDENGKV